ncbi:MAG: phytanoyl-CoA dioxygenase family protein [Rhodospirillales bacterium]
METSPLQTVRSASIPSSAPSFPIRDPTNRDLIIPATAEEDTKYFVAEQEDDLLRYYREEGYVVVRNLLPATLCETAMAWFDKEIKPSDAFIYRQTTANPERHEFTPHGFMLNPILNIQSLDARRFPKFREAGLAIITHAKVQAVLRKILGEDGKLVQSMYFQGNSETWAHQDTYYLDAEEPGRMIAAWFAVEDIAPGAGRFFIYPKSHLIDMAKNGGDFDVAFNHDRYKQLVIDVIRHHGLECRAPALRRGDVLFWSSKVIHGSLETRQPEYSRSSFTAHYIPGSSRFLQFQSRIRGLNLETIAGMRVHKPKDLNRPSRRGAFWVETTFPKSFQTVKRFAIKALTR